MKGSGYLISLAIIAFVFVSVITGCASRETTTPITTSSTTTAYKDVTAKEAMGLIQNNTGNIKFVILDVRTPDEFNSGHIKDALNIDVNSTNFEQEVGKLDKSKTYLVYCRSGVRSKNASDIMLGLGFRYIYNMTGGILQWQTEGYPVVQ